MNKQELIKRIRTLAHNSEKSHPAVASVLLTLTATMQVGEDEELHLAAHVTEFGDALLRQLESELELYEEFK